MNSSEIKAKIQNTVNTIIEANHQRYRRQYPVTKWAREELQALGLWEYVENAPRTAGQTDAQDILKSASSYVEGSDETAELITGTIARLLRDLRAAEQVEAVEDENSTQPYEQVIVSEDGIEYYVVLTQDEDGYHVFPEYDDGTFGGAFDAPDWDDTFSTMAEAVAFANQVHAEMIEDFEDDFEDEFEDFESF